MSSGSLRLQLDVGISVNAIPAARLMTENLSVGRAHHEGISTIGNVQSSHSVCYLLRRRRNYRIYLATES